MHPPSRVEAAPVVEFQQPAVPLIEIKSDADDISEGALESLPVAPQVTTRRLATVSLRNGESVNVRSRNSTNNFHHTHVNRAADIS